MMICSRRKLHFVKEAGAVLVLIAATVSLARGTTWPIEYDMASPDGQIGRLVEVVASGDTILVGPGEYREHIFVSQGQSLTLIGREGAERTVLDGGVDFPDRERSILYSGPPFSERSGNLTLQGLMFKRGAGSIVWMSTYGGAVYWAHGEGVTVTDCVFQENHTDESTGYGGALHIETTLATVERCSFVGNGAYYGGGVWINSAQAVAVRHCTFDVAGVFSGSAAIYVRWGSPVVIEDNEITQGLSDEGGCIGLRGLDVHVTDNRIISQSNHAGRLIYWATGQYGPLNPTVELSNNVFSAAGGGENSAQVSFDMFGQDAVQVAMRNNAFIHAAVMVHAVPDLQISQNLFYESPLDVCYASGSVSCCVSWPDSLSVPSSCSSHQMNFERVLVADPQLCSTTSGLAEVADSSPCLGNDELPGCGVIGGVTVGCYITPVRVTSWGNLKARFR
jgi:hypothetical protein